MCYVLCFLVILLLLLHILPLLLFVMLQPLPLQLLNLIRRVGPSFWKFENEEWNPKYGMEELCLRKV